MNIFTIQNLSTPKGFIPVAKLAINEEPYEVVMKLNSVNKNTFSWLDAEMDDGQGSYRFIVKRCGSVVDVTIKNLTNSPRFSKNDFPKYGTRTMSMDRFNYEFEWNLNLLEKSGVEVSLLKETTQ